MLRGEEKVYGPAPIFDQNDLEAVEEIYECICVAHPGFNEQVFLTLLILSVKWLEILRRRKRRISDTYSMSQLPHTTEAGDTPDVPIISYTAALEFLDGLRLFRLQKGIASSAQQQTIITSFCRPQRDIS